MQQLNKLEEDLNTITAGDFTVEIDISDAMYKFFKKHQYEPKGKDAIEEGGNETYSAALYLKKHLTEEISDMLSKAMKHRQEYNQ